MIKAGRVARFFRIRSRNQDQFSSFPMYTTPQATIWSSLFPFQKHAIRSNPPTVFFMKVPSPESAQNA
jgi:hypothetical protein